MEMTLAEYLTRQFSLQQYGEFFLRILIACLCGASIGIERSKRLKEAGIRTHIIVCCAAALTMIVSKYGFADLVSPDGTTLYGSRGADSARVAAQIISGVSFLGAGIIFRNDRSIKGLTTAACIWATAGIGLTIGAGMYVMGLFVTGVLALVQYLTHKYSIGVDSMVVGKIRCEVRDPDAFRKALEEYADRNRMQILHLRFEIKTEGGAVFDLTLRMKQDMSITDLSAFLDSVGDAHAISFALEI